jgi:exodeoxyribonuclease-3
MRIATWNVNSIRARQLRLNAWLEKHSPDVLCLQELKVEEAKYPRAELAALGYVSAINAQKTYNGVAILSRHPMTAVEVGLADGVEDPQARLVAATVLGVRIISVYVPNGQSLTSDKWPYKLAWLKRLRTWLDKHETKDQPLALCGDFNVAPEAIDTHDPALWEGETLFHPLAREALQNVSDFGLVDTFRAQHPGEANLFSWWDYRMLGFPKNEGLRIDHILATPPLATRCTQSVIDREERKGDAPSDHAPVVSTFEL